MDNQRDIIGAIITLARLIKTEADKRARAHGMTRAQWGILINLERQPGLLQKELAELLEVEPITVARLIDRLEARGMVERRGRSVRPPLLAPASDRCVPSVDGRNRPPSGRTGRDLPRRVSTAAARHA